MRFWAAFQALCKTTLLHVLGTDACVREAPDISGQHFDLRGVVAAFLIGHLVGFAMVDHADDEVLVSIEA